MNDFHFCGLIPHPGEVFDCTEASCAEDRRIIESLTALDPHQLDDLLSCTEDTVKSMIEVATRMRAARTLQQRREANEPH